MPRGHLKVLGDLGERLACRFLVAKGYVLVERNWHCRMGEIDLILKDGDCVVFVEVKLRTSLAFGFVEESVSVFKLRRFFRACREYCYRNNVFRFRRDVVFIEYVSGRARLRHLANVSN